MLLEFLEKGGDLAILAIFDWLRCANDVRYFFFLKIIMVMANSGYDVGNQDNNETGNN